MIELYLSEGFDPKPDDNEWNDETEVRQFRGPIVWSVRIDLVIAPDVTKDREEEDTSHQSREDGDDETEGGVSDIDAVILSVERVMMIV